MTEKLIWYQTMARREALGEDECFKLQLLEHGRRGEDELFGMVQSIFGPDAWVARNLWLDQQVECDVLLVTHSRIVNLNAKYYRGDFKFAQGKAYFGDKELRSNPLAVFQTSMDRLRELVRRVGLNVPVEGMLVFMNPDYSVTVDESALFPCLARSQVKRVLKELQRDSARAVGNGRAGARVDMDDFGGSLGGSFGGAGGLDIQWTGSRLMTLKSESKYGPPRVNDTHLSRLVRGLVCPKCGGRHLAVSQRSVVCPCRHYTVTKAEATCHAIEEYCILFHDAPLVTAAEIDWFLAGGVPRKTITRQLSTHYKLNSRGKYAAYINPHYRQPFGSVPVRAGRRSKS